jgi:hypothetical protein
VDRRAALEARWQRQQARPSTRRGGVAPLRHACAFLPLLAALFYACTRVCALPLRARRWRRRTKRPAAPARRTAWCALLRAARAAHAPKKAQCLVTRNRFLRVLILRCAHSRAPRAPLRRWPCATWPTWRAPAQHTHTHTHTPLRTHAHFSVLTTRPACAFLRGASLTLISFSVSLCSRRARRSGYAPRRAPTRWCCCTCTWTPAASASAPQHSTPPHHLSLPLRAIHSFARIHSLI